ncbi:Hce2 domain containing protein [Pyrenophora tritici-repentis]|uniref:Ecp2 effector protein-like domain-containing protein n=2 Tax=Pyrenophora tritici-repentis TaxID=45151 RepID=B2VRG9_PYRTR|nr:uncharacterized protein PTRG_00203 [Pyrenophora tritici-repentis Pt-1C-BFP]EDU39641.1 hypothetical protein PTRG_00203 [Pyrenophora tritici-repentis Pt-1C-BFP]KAF7453187.1 Hce2 domain containing protein [Pyrenophora tritici-repentis]
MRGTTLIMSLFFTAITALPQGLSPSINYCAGNKQTIGHCEVLSYVDTTTSASNPPTVKECQEACWSVFMDAGDWAVPLAGKPEGYRQRMVGSPCGFSIAAIPNTTHDFSFAMDNQDIADIIDEVVKRFAPLHGGRVAAEGTVRCDGHEAKWWVSRDAR